MIAIRDECTTCRWLGKEQKEEVSSCTRPGECFWAWPQQDKSEVPKKNTNK